MTNARSISASVCLFCALVLVTPAGAGSPKTYNLEGPQVTLPADVTVQRREGPDFLLYYFKKDKKQILFAYVGAAPGFPMSVPKYARVTKDEVNGMDATTYAWRNARGACRETLLKTKRHDFAQYVHFVYSRLSVADTTTADGIITSTIGAPPPKKQH